MTGDPPRQKDFRGHRERWPAKPFKNECRACGLSVYKSIDDAYRAQRNIPGMKKKRIAFGVLEEADGRLLNTPAKTEPSHHTWWKPAGLAVAERFHVLEAAA